MYDYFSYGDYINHRLLDLSASGIVIRSDAGILPSSLFLSGFYLYFRIVCCFIAVLIFVEKIYQDDTKGGD